MYLTPKGIDLTGNKKIVCMSFTSMGYPDVMYDMYYRLNVSTYIPITNQSCLEHSVVHKDVSIRSNHTDTFMTSVQHSCCTVIVIIVTVQI